MRAFFFLTVLMLCGSTAYAEDLPVFNLTLKNHAFVPPELTVPAGQKFKLILANEDPSAAEFESSDLDREKVVPAQGTITIFFDPLDPGIYNYFDDFHADQTTGKLIAK